MKENEAFANIFLIFTELQVVEMLEVDTLVEIIIINIWQRRNQKNMYYDSYGREEYAKRRLWSGKEKRMKNERRHSMTYKKYWEKLSEEIWFKWI